jgi:hypothetical protein
MVQFWLRDKEAGVIFLMSVDSVEEADGLLTALPLGQADLLTFELMGCDLQTMLDHASTG